MTARTDDILRSAVLFKICITKQLNFFMKDVQMTVKID